MFGNDNHGYRHYYQVFMAHSDLRTGIRPGVSSRYSDYVNNVLAYMPTRNLDRVLIQVGTWPNYADTAIPADH